MRGPLRSFSKGGEVGGWHVATVKYSTNLRMKKRGKVPPRLETLFWVLVVAFAKEKGKSGKEVENIRSQQRHVGAANGWIRDLCMEC